MVHVYRLLPYLLLALLAASVELMADDAEQVFVNIAAVTSSDDLRPVDGIRSTGQPSAEQFALAAAAGYVAVVDLRGLHEDRGIDEEAALEELGLDYVLLPIENADDISMANAAALDELLSDYDGPVLLHCGSGNRVGALLALRQKLLGADADDALAYGKSAGLTGLEPLVRQRLQQD